MPEGNGEYPMDSWAKAVVKALAILLSCISAFGIGFVAVFFLLWWVFTPSVGCEAPCDGGGYLAMGYTLLIGPVVGIAFSWGALLALRKIQRNLRNRKATTI